VVGTQDVHLQRPFHDRGVAADQRQLRGDACVRDHDIQATQAANHRLDRLLDLGAHSDVALRPWRVPAARGDVAQQLALQADERDAGTAGVQPLGEGSTDAPRGAGDEYPLTGQVCLARARHVCTVAIL